MSVSERERTERRLAAILMADVVGYSRLMGKNEDGTHLALKAVQREVTDPKVAEHRGRLVKTIGDGLLVEFASVVDAVRCAVDIQRAMALRNAEAAANDPIVFRIGINLGDIISENGDIYGDGVNVAARLEGLAPPGGICVSRVVRDQVRDKLGFGFEDMGPQRVKNIARPIHVFRVPLDPPPATDASPAAAVPKPGVLQPRTRFALPAAIGGSVAAFGALFLLVVFAPWSREAPHPAAAPPPPTIGDAIIFGKDKVFLPPAAEKTIERQAAFLRDNPKITVTIETYCSQDEGAREGRQTLAALRANQIRDALKARGVGGDRVMAENRCQTIGAAAPGDRAAEAQQRRALLIRN
jgi:class 3 adenylate cyclase